MIEPPITTMDVAPLYRIRYKVVSEAGALW